MKFFRGMFVGHEIFEAFFKYSLWSELYAVIAAYWIGALTDEKVSLARTLIFSINKFKFLGITKYPNLHPPAAHHLLKPSLMIVFSGQKFEIDLKLLSKVNS